MIEGEGTLDAAEQTLREAYTQIALQAGQLTHRVVPDVENTIVHIMPKGRRVESGWFKMATWADKNDAVIESLDMEDRAPAPSRDEVFVAGEALAGSPRDVVNLLFHQFIHQLAGIESSSTYHGNGYMQAAHSLGVWETKRHATQGWVEFDYGINLDSVLQRIAESLDAKSFDLYRHPEAQKMGSGKMKLWKCSCRRGPSVYTGGILHATCDKCGYRFMYAHKDRFNPDVAAKITRAGEQVME